MSKEPNVFVSIPFYFEDNHAFNFGLKLNESGSIERFVEKVPQKGQILDSYTNSKGELVIVVEMPE